MERNKEKLIYIISLHLILINVSSKRFDIKIVEITTADKLIFFLSRLVRGVCNKWETECLCFWFSFEYV